MTTTSADSRGVEPMTEMTDHLGYELHAVEGRGSGNSRNGAYPKTVTTDKGPSSRPGRRAPA